MWGVPSHCEAGIERNRCHMWLHYHCTLLPIYFLIALTNSSKRCTKNTYSNYGEQSNELEKCISEAHKACQTPPQTVPDTQVNQQTQPSLPHTHNTIHITQPRTPEDVLGSTPEDIDLSNIPPSHTNPREDQHRPHTNSDQHTNQVKNKPQKPLCRYHKKGICKFGASGKNCPFTHPHLCERFIRNGQGHQGCKRGPQCKYLHPHICNDSWRKGECLKSNCIYIHLQGTKTVKQRPQNQRQARQQEMLPKRTRKQQNKPRHLR